MKIDPHNVGLQMVLAACVAISACTACTSGEANLQAARARNEPLVRMLSTSEGVIDLSAYFKSDIRYGGSGVLRDLREAMSLGTPKSQALVEAVQAFAQAPTRDAQQAALPALLLAWAEAGPDLNASLLTECELGRGLSEGGHEFAECISR